MGAKRVQRLRSWTLLGDQHLRDKLFFFFPLLATPVAYGSSWARGGIAAAAAGLHQILNPLSEGRDQTHIFTETTLGP